MPATDIEHFHGGVCACCGTDTAYTRGVVRNGRERVARYLVKWAIGNRLHDMRWLIALPQSGSERDLVVSLIYSFEQDSFMVRHRGEELWTPEELAGFGDLLHREHVIGTPLADRVFSVVDDIWLTDPYIQEFVAASAS